MTGHPCPYCNAIFAYPRGLALHCHSMHSNAEDMLSISYGGVLKLGCPFCKERISQPEDKQPTTALSFFEDCAIDEVWRDHFKQCTAYAAAMLSGVKL